MSRRNILIVSSPRCKSTVIMRLLAGRHAKIISEPFTQSFYSPNNVEQYNPSFPSNYTDTQEFIREQVKHCSNLSIPLVIKILAYQAFDAFVHQSSLEFIQYLRSNFHIVYLVRDPNEVCNSIARKLIELKQPADSFSEYCCFQDLFTLMQILKPNDIVSVSRDVDPNPHQFIQRIWNKNSTFTTTTHLPQLSREEISQAGLDIWPSWYDRAITQSEFKKSNTNPHILDSTLFPKDFMREIEQNLPKLQYYFERIIAYSNNLEQR